jgi:putative transposase
MARLPRLCIPGQVHHVLWRGGFGQQVFVDPDDRNTFLAHLAEVARTHRLAVHAWALMPDHIHLLLTPQDAAGLSVGMQALGRRHVQSFNRRHARRGTLWEGRFRSTVLEADPWLLRAMVWVDTHPQRSGLAAEVGQGHAWVSAAHYLGAQSHPALTVPPAYWALGNTPFAREAAYRALLEQGCAAAHAEALAQAALKGWVLGSEAFVAALQNQTVRRLQPARPGRPPKKDLLSQQN